MKPLPLGHEWIQVLVIAYGSKSDRRRHYLSQLTDKAQLVVKHVWEEEISTDPEILATVEELANIKAANDQAARELRKGGGKRVDGKSYSIRSDEDHGLYDRFDSPRGDTC